MNSIDQNVLENAQQWLKGNFDQETRDMVREMIENDPQELVESFYRHLEFGTGGLRGIMGVGTNRMNKYTVGMATQGFANYLKMMFPSENQISIAVAFDSRNNSSYFAQITAEVMSANGIKVYLFDSLRPTPELSFAVRHYGCQGGVVVTASHNPKEYNGYKAYWDDGGQLINPHDVNVIKEVEKIKSPDDVKFQGNNELIQIIGPETDKIYLNEIKKLSLSPKAIENHKDMGIVYTPIHGTGYQLVPEALKLFGFNNVSLVKEQEIPDGNFPTVKSPNPEEPAALKLAIEQAVKENADIVMATDPDSDRVGIAVRDNNGSFILLNGNQTATILFYYVLEKWHARKKLSGNEFIVKTIVTTELLAEIAKGFGVKYFDVLTGFKFIADKIRFYEGTMKFIIGGEESYGYMVGDFVRDKDAVSACALIAETAAYAREQGKTLFELLLDIYLEFGFYKEKLLSVVRQGKAGAEEIQAMMDGFRKNPPDLINHSKVVEIKDYLTQKGKDPRTGEEYDIDLPKSNVLQFITEDGSKISMRPSGTEPKIKFYFGVKTKLNKRKDYSEMNTALDEKISGIIKDLNL